MLFFDLDLDLDLSTFAAGQGADIWNVDVTDDSDSADGGEDDLDIAGITDHSVRWSPSTGLLMESDKDDVFVFTSQTPGSGNATGPAQSGPVVTSVYSSSSASSSSASTVG